MNEYTLEQAAADTKTLYRLRKEADKLTELVDRQIADLDAERQLLVERRQEILRPIEEDIAYYESLLKLYMEEVRAEDPKTKSVKLPYATLSSTTKPQDYKRDDDKLLGWVQAHNPDCVKVPKPTVDWAALKRQLAPVDDGRVIVKDTGEVVEGVEALPREVVYKVEVLSQ